MTFMTNCTVYEVMTDENPRASSSSAPPKQPPFVDSTGLLGYSRLLRAIYNYLD